MRLSSFLTIRGSAMALALLLGFVPPVTFGLDADPAASLTLDRDAVAVAAAPDPQEGQAGETRDGGDDAQPREERRGVDLQEGLGFLDTGPLRIREQFLLSQGFLAFDPVSADVLAKGQWQIDAVFSATNTWSLSASVEEFLDAREQAAPLTVEQLRSIEPFDGQDGIYFSDGELYRTSVAVRVGLGKGIQLGLTVPVINFQGGFGDELIEEFHDSTGFGQAGRLGVPQDNYQVYLRDPEGNEIIRNQDPGTGIGDVTLSLKGRVPIPEGRWRLSLEGLLKLSTGDEEDLYSSGNEDYATQVHVTRYFDRSCIHASFGVLQLGSSEVFNTDEQTLLSGMIGYEHALGRWSSVIAQVSAFESPFQDLEIEELEDVNFLVDVGIKRGFSEHLVGFLAFTENFSTFGASGDFGLHLGLTQTF